MRILLLALLSACTLTRGQVEQIRGELWQNDGLAPEVCARNPELWYEGIYRVVKCPNRQIDGCRNGEDTYEEFISYCSKRIKTMITADRIRVEEWLRRASRATR